MSLRQLLKAIFLVLVLKVFVPGKEKRTFFSAFSNPFGHRFDKIPQPLMFADGVRRQHLKVKPHFDHFICIPCHQHALVEKDLNLLERSCPGHFTYLKDKEQ